METESYSKEKNRQISKKMNYFKNLWITRINRTVPISDLNRILKNLLNRGINIDYLIFVLEYCIENNLNLNYPNGFQYFVDKKEIKSEYEKSIIHTCIKNDLFVVKDDDSKSLQVTANPKSKGFQSIIGR